MNASENAAKKSASKRNHLIWIKFIAIFLLALGIIFRFANLGSKVYWGDETVTSLRLSGYTLEELKTQAFSGEEMSVAQLQKYQYPNQEKSAIATIKGLAVEEPQHPPLYFLTARIWVQQFGNSVAVTRSFSALVSLLAFPAIYWLCQELFESPLVGWIAVALIAVSPFHVLYAQEARSYSLWMVTILLASAALLQAIRRATVFSWGIYAVTLATGLYTILLSGIVAIGHGVYVVASENFKFTKTLRAYLISSIAAIILFTPWIVTVLASFSEADETTSWTKAAVPPKSLVRTWLLNLSRLFVDFNYNFVTRNWLMYLVIGTITVLVGYALYFLCRHTSKRVWLFVLTLIGTILALVLPDLILGGIRSSVARYLIPSYLGIQLAVAYLLASKIVSASNWQRQAWKLVAIALFSGSVISCAVSAQAEVWWNKYNAVQVPEIAQIVNQSSDPIFVTSWHGLMAFSHVFERQVRFQPLSSQPVSISKKNSEVFVHNSSEALQEIRDRANYQVQQEYQWKQRTEPVYEVKSTLWELTKP